MKDDNPKKLLSSAFDYGMSYSRDNFKLPPESIVENNFEEWLTDKMEKYYKDFLGKYLFSEGSTNVLYSNCELEYLAGKNVDGRYLKTLSLKNMRITEINSEYCNYSGTRGAHPNSSMLVDSFSILSNGGYSKFNTIDDFYKYILDVCTISSFIIDKKGYQRRVIFFLYHPKENIVFFEVQKLYPDSDEGKWYNLYTITKSVKNIVSKRKYSSFILKGIIFPSVKYRMKKFDCDMSSITLLK